MKVINMQVRTKKIEYTNTFTGGNIRLNPQINFNVSKVSDHRLVALCDVKIEDQDPNYPLKLDIIVECLFEFSEDTTQEEMDFYIKDRGIETVYAYTRSNVSNITAISGITPINLPIINFNERKDEEKKIS